MHSFLWLSNSPLCTCTTTIHPSVDGYLHCFHFLTNVSVTLFWLCKYYSSQGRQRTVITVFINILFFPRFNSCLVILLLGFLWNYQVTDLVIFRLLLKFPLRRVRSFSDQIPLNASSSCLALVCLLSRTWDAAFGHASGNILWIPCTSSLCWSPCCLISSLLFLGHSFWWSVSFSRFLRSM